MSANMIAIASTGLKAARAALEVTSQNIANAGTDGYVRRSVALTEQSANNLRASYGEVTQLGVRVSGITRNVSAFSQSEVRRTTSDAARADTLVDGLTNLSDTADNSSVFTAITNFQSALSQMTSSPANSSLRANVVEAARTMAQSFNSANAGLQSAVTGAQSEASSGVSELNDLASSLATLNKRISGDTDPANNSAGLLDQRDTILQQMSALTNINTTFNDDNTVTVTLPGSPASTLVDHGTANSLSMNTGTDGNISFAVGANAFTPTGGSLAGQQQVISAGVTAKANLDTIANSMMTTINDAQANGVDLTGATGSAMFSGTGAANMAMVLTSPNQLAAASAGSSASSQNGTNLNAMIGALDSANVSGQMNDYLFGLSSAVASNTTMRDALDTIASNAKTSLAAASGVDLDTEAAALIRYQQAYQASSKVIQIASTLFDQLLNL